MFEADITKVVEEMSVRIRETEEDFILDTIFPYCQEILQRKINKAELKQIILRGSRPKGKWITWKEAGNYIPSETRFECSVCHDAAQTLCNGLDLLSPYCPNCGAEMSGGGEDEDR